MGKKTVQHLREGLLTHNDLDYAIGGDGLSTLTEDVECTAAKLIKSNSRAKLSMEFISTFCAFWFSVMSHMSMSFCE
jgi:hypothetical protein